MSVIEVNRLEAISLKQYDVTAPNGPKGLGNLAQASAWVPSFPEDKPCKGGGRTGAPINPKHRFVEMHMMPIQKCSVFLLESELYVMLSLLGNTFDHRLQS